MTFFLLPGTRLLSFFEVNKERRLNGWIEVSSFRSSFFPRCSFQNYCESSLIKSASPVDSLWIRPAFSSLLDRALRRMEKGMREQE